MPSLKRLEEQLVDESRRAYGKPLSTFDRRTMASASSTSCSRRAVICSIEGSAGSSLRQGVADLVEDAAILDLLGERDLLVRAQQLVASDLVEIQLDGIGRFADRLFGFGLHGGHAGAGGLRQRTLLSWCDLGFFCRALVALPWLT